MHNLNSCGFCLDYGVHFRRFVLYMSCLLEKWRWIYATVGLTRAENTGPLSYMGKAPLSARFYSRGRVDEVELAAQPLNKQEGSNTQEFVAISNKERHRYALPKEAVAVFSNRRYTLYRLEGAYLAPIVATKSERYFKAEPRSSNLQH